MKKSIRTLKLFPVGIDVFFIENYEIVKRKYHKNDKEFFYFTDNNSNPLILSISKGEADWWLESAKACDALWEQLVQKVHKVNEDYFGQTKQFHFEDEGDRYDD